MKVHLRQIPDDGAHLEGEENCPLPELQKDEVRCIGPLRYNLNVGIAGDALWANGLLEQPVELRCVRCLEKFAHTITVPEFALHMDLPGRETVDLTPAIREDILLNLPAHPHCDRDGGRQCAKPLAKATEEDEEARREHDWEALDKLKLKG
jgi:uncharacterized metal-binding protein YceD (DUF177 family)